MAARNYHGLILAGGRGTRFWPRSRGGKPKQLLPFLSERSLIQETVDRLIPLIPPERLWILTNEKLRRQVMRQLPEVPRRQILAEPVARNTAPAIGLAASVIHGIDPEAVLGIFPSDHHIAQPARFRRLARAAYREAARGRIVVLGIQPRWPEPGYGYVEFPAGVQAGSAEAVEIRQFCEKPALATAKRFLAAGRYFWNAGMFFWRAGVYLSELERHLPRTAELLRGLPAFRSRNFRGRLAESFPRMDNISVDYAVLEKTDRVFGIAASGLGWNDLGCWRALYELLAKHPGANVTQSDALLTASEGNYIDAPGKLVAMLGVKDLIVVDTGDALLLADRHRAQQVGELVRLLRKLGRDDLL